MSCWHFVATDHFVCTGEFLWKSLSLQQNFVPATSCTTSNWFDFLWLVAAIKFSCEHRDFHKSSPVGLISMQMHVKFMCVNEIEAIYERPCITSLNFHAYVWPSIHYLYFIYAGKINLYMHIKITRQWKSTCTHKAVCCCTMSPQRVAATSRLTCTQGVICHCDVLLQLVAKCVLTLELHWFHTSN